MKKKLKIVGIIFLAFGTLMLSLATWSTSGFATLGGDASGARLERMKKSPQFDGEKFQNIPPVVMRMESDSGVAWSVTKEWFNGDQLRVPDKPIDLFDGRDILGTPPTSELRVTWLGHSTVIIEIDGVRLLTDPVWGERVSPSSIAGPKRFHPPPYSLDEIGEIDAVLISHDHYDHLDYETILSLKDRGVPFLVPLGVGAHFEAWDVPTPQIREFDWWEETTFDGVTIAATPARHFSGRGPLNRNSTLWTSWTLIGPKHRVYFSGDTGPTSDFTDIAKKYGPFDVTMFEVGAYHPSWGEIHLGPEAAIQAHLQMGNKGVMLPIHWSTFELAIHGWSEPAEQCEKFAAENDVELATPRVGEPFEPAQNVPTDSWWR